MNSAENIALILSVFANAILAVFSAYSRARNRIMTAKTQTNRKIQMLENVVLIFMEAKNFEEAKKLAKIVLENFEKNNLKIRTDIEKKNIVK